MMFYGTQFFRKNFGNFCRHSIFFALKWLQIGTFDLDHLMNTFDRIKSLHIQYGNFSLKKCENWQKLLTSHPVKFTTYCFLISKFLS